MADSLHYQSKKPAAQQQDPAHEHADSLVSYLIVFALLVFFLLLTVFVYQFDMGVLNTVVALIIATVKTALVMLVFMHLRHGTKLTWVIAGAGFIWLSIMITFTFADYLSRGAIPENVKMPVAPTADVVVHSPENAQ
jgi:cytochrome c oxidase subunit 4